uniref:Uncharacterized protein n=1 Tax=Coccolithus braarudii TaxID=221442 RepID=A0A7S0LFN7_9EUKA
MSVVCEESRDDASPAASRQLRRIASLGTALGTPFSPHVQLGSSRLREAAPRTACRPPQRQHPARNECTREGEEDGSARACERGWAERERAKLCVAAVQELSREGGTHGCSEA